ncbi:MULTISPECIES: hypothetical protein [Micrococcaceae]|uniref:hypothetical protein n=1 Tax=Micrococcaceae TaxID=1268 RepID=UPI0016225CCA|nr:MULTISPECIES: hypothetical protein [Micrococcaceae]MBB5748390.1 hypothetical protein [Micrococcus sp. TA1]HRO29546.1 hypothetical protein [Citricoccus sp.]HRO93500.1 hypothetical protein [Citricoccus sp.]
MNGLDGAGIVGDLLSWVGLCLGLPLLLAGMLRRSRERSLVATEVVIVRGPPEPQARWFASGEFYDRPLHATEHSHYAGRDVCTGYVSPREPWVMGFERHRQATGTCLALGATFIIIGLCGLILSIIPLVIG